MTWDIAWSNRVLFDVSTISFIVLPLDDNLFILFRFFTSSNLKFWTGLPFAIANCASFCCWELFNSWLTTPFLKFFSFIHWLSSDILSLEFAFSRQWSLSVKEIILSWAVVSCSLQVSIILINWPFWLSIERLWLASFVFGENMCWYDFIELDLMDLFDTRLMLLVFAPLF